MDNEPQGLEPFKNTGVIIDVRPTDFRAGAETGVAYEARNPSGDWEKYKPTDEWQRRNVKGNLGYDTYSCVTFSALRCVAMQIEFLIETGKAPQAFIDFLNAKGYIDDQGKVNFNENYTAVLSGTTEAGNTGQNVWDSIRRDGLLAQGKGPSVNDYTTLAGWLGFKPSAEQIAEAQEILQWLTVQYEWVLLGQSGQQATMAYHLKQAPLHVFAPVCPTWNTRDGLVLSCGRTILDHATSTIAIEPALTYKELDHYDPFVKHLAADYYVAWAIKGLVNIKGAPTTTPPPFLYTYNTTLHYGTPANPEIHALQQGLQTVKDSAGKPFMTVGLFGGYFTATRDAVNRFQKSRGIVDPQPGENFGPQTRAALTAALKALQ